MVQRNNTFNLSLFLSPLIISIIILACFLGQQTGIINTQIFGVLPRSSNGILGILGSPLVHGDIEHLLGNLSVLFPLLILLQYVYKKDMLKVLLILWVLTGFLVWIFARPSLHIGASGIVYAIQTFLLISGVVKRQAWMMAVGAISIMLFGGGFMFGLLPVEPHVSWESHLLGAITGTITALALKQLGPQNRVHKKTRTHLKDEYEFFDINKRQK